MDETKKTGGGFGLAVKESDIGLSPNVMKGSVFSKKNKGPMSPIGHADKFKLGRR